MEIRVYEDIEEFYALAFPFLITREAENNLQLSILNHLRQDIRRYGEEIPFLLLMEERDEVRLIALRTPPYDLSISYTDDLELINILVEELFKRKEKLPGVISFKKTADKFAKLWSKKNSLKLHLLRKERMYQLEEVSKETLGQRKFTVATKINQDLVLKWASEMMMEALTEINEEELERNLTNIKKEFKEENSTIYLLFENDKPVSMARKAGKTPNGKFVNLVYTPPSLRRKGYATECVAKLSKLILEEGNRYCFLFTDLSNPTSNSIYQKIGYRPVIDENHYKFISK